MEKQSTTKKLEFMFVGATTVAKRLATRARDLRLERNWSQEELASRSGVSFGTINRFEKGAPVGLPNFIRLVDALGRMEDLESLLEPRKAPSIAERLALSNVPVRKRATKKGK